MKALFDVSSPLSSVLGADKRMENDEPLFLSLSSSDEDDESEKNDANKQLPDDMVQQVQFMSISSERGSV